MDHHCIWLGRCVGYSNQPAFLIFLFGAVFGALHSTIMVIAFRPWSKFDRQIIDADFYSINGNFVQNFAR